METALAKERFGSLDRLGFSLFYFRYVARVIISADIKQGPKIDPREARD